MTARDYLLTVAEAWACAEYVWAHVREYEC